MEPSGIKGYFAMSVVDAAKVRRLEVLWSNSASITFKNKAPTPFIFFHDEPLDALEAAELAVGSPGNNEWMVLEVKFTPFQVFKLFVSHRICRVETPSRFDPCFKYGFRVYHADASDADKGLDLTEHEHRWLRGQKRLSIEQCPAVMGMCQEGRRGDWQFIEAGTVGQLPNDEDMGCPASASIL